MAAGSQTLTIKNLVAPAYSFSGAITVTGWSLIGKKVADQFTFPITLNIAACSSFTEFNQSASSYYSSQNNVTLSFEFITGELVFFLL